MPEPTITIKIRAQADAQGLRAWRSELREANAELAKAPVDSPQFKAAARQAAVLTENIRAQREVIKQAVETARLELAAEQAAIDATNAKVLAMGNPWTTASRTIRAQAQQTTPAIQDLGKAAEAAAGKPGAGGMGLLLLGQALEDAQYGLRGVMNNIPGLVMSFGLGAGAAGVLQVGLVALSQILDIVGKQTKELEKTDWAALSPDEQVEQRHQKVIERLQQEIEAVQTLSAKMEHQNELRQKALEIDQNRQKFSNEQLAATGQSTEGQKLQDEYLARQAERQGQLSQAAAKTQQAERLAAQAQAAATPAEAAAAAQAQRIQDLENRSKLEEQLKQQQEKVKEAQRTLATAEGGAQGYLQPSVRAQMQAEIDARRAEEKRLAGQVTALPTPEGWQPTGNAAKDAEEKAKALAKEKELANALRDEAATARKQADEAQRTLEKERLNLLAVREQTQQADTGDRQRSAAAIAKASGLPEPLPGQEGALLSPATRSLLTPGQTPEERAAEDEKRKAQEMATFDQDFAKQNLQSDVEAMVQQLQTSMKGSQDEGMRTMLRGLIAQLTDGQGNTAEELAKITALYSQASADKQQASTLLAETVRAIGEMSRGTANGIAQINAALREANSRIAALEREQASSRQTMSN